MAPRRSSPLRSSSFARMDPTMVERMLAASGSASRSRSRTRSASATAMRHNKAKSVLTSEVEPRSFYTSQNNWLSDGVAPSTSWRAMGRTEDEEGGNVKSGFLLHRARTQRMTSLTSKRSRSSSVASSCAPHPYAVSRPPQANNSILTAPRREPRKETLPYSAAPAKSTLPSQVDGSHMFRGMTAKPLSTKVAQSVTPPLPNVPKSASEKLPFGRDPSTGSMFRAQPLWCMIGTFKTSLENVVQVSQGVMQWHQRNPNGGFQRMVVPLSLVSSVTCATVVVSKVETTHSVIIKTDGKPCQITFGFVRQCDGNTFRLRLLTLIDARKS